MRIYLISEPNSEKHIWCIKVLENINQDMMYQNEFIFNESTSAIFFSNLPRVHAWTYECDFGSIVIFTF